MACLTGHDRFVGVEAVEPSTALSLSRQSLRGLIAEQPAFYVKILKTTIELHANRVTRGTNGNVQKAEDGPPSLCSVRPQSQVEVDPLTLTSHN